MVAEDVSLLEALRGTVLEAEAEEVTEIGGRAAAELDGDGRGKVGDGLEFWVLLDHAGLVEERDEGLVGGLDQQELERVTVEGDALERVDDRVQDGATSDVTNTSNVLVGEDAVLVVVSERAGLLVEGGGEAVGVGLVVGQLGVDEVVDVPCVLESGGAAEHVVLDTTEEWLSILGLGLELGRAVEVLDVLLEVLQKKEACKSRVRKNGSGTFLEKEKKRDPIRGKKPPKSPKRHGNPGSPHTFLRAPEYKKKKRTIEEKTYRAVGPGLERAVVARFNGFNWYVLITAEGRNDSGLVGQVDLVVGVGGEQTLEEGDGRVENDGALSSRLHADLELAVVDNVRSDSWDVGRR